MGLDFFEKNIHFWVITTRLKRKFNFYCCRNHIMPNDSSVLTDRYCIFNFHGNLCLIRFWKLNIYDVNKHQIIPGLKFKRNLLEDSNCKKNDKISFWRIVIFTIFTISLFCSKFFEILYQNNFKLKNIFNC